MSSADIYYVFAAIGLLLGSVSYFYLACQKGICWHNSVKIWAVALFFGVFGSKIFHTLFEAKSHFAIGEQSSNFVLELLAQDPWHWARLFSPGYVLYGGLIFGMIAASLALKLLSVPEPLKYADSFAPALAVGIGIGRIGCFYAGCCFGQMLPFAPGLPVQLSEAGFLLILAYSLLIHPSNRDGAHFEIFLLSYAVFRFFIEFFRADESRGHWIAQTFSTSQIISILILAGLGINFWMKNRKKVLSKLR